MEEQLRAISPVDGRYHKVSKKLGNYFSEFALIQYPVRVEVEYFIALCELPLPQLQNFDRARFIELRDIYLDFEVKDAERIKETMIMRISVSIN